MFSQKQIEKKLAESPLIFVGTVKKPGASNLRALPPSDLTALIAINTVATAPNDYRGITGTTITVKLPAKTKLKKGDQRVFYARHLMHGENLALEATSLDTVDADHQQIVKTVRDAKATLERNAQLGHINKAPLIVEGKVTRLEEAQFNQLFPGHFRAPYWVAARISISRVIKGNHPAKDIEVYFNKGGEEDESGGAPEIEVGQTGVWLPHTEKILQPFKDTRDFLVIEDRNDFLPSYEYATLANLNHSI